MSNFTNQLELRKNDLFNSTRGGLPCLTFTTWVASWIYVGSVLTQIWGGLLSEYDDIDINVICPLNQQILWILIEFISFIFNKL